MERLLTERRLQRVETSEESVAALLAAAGRHLDLARSGGAVDPEGAFTLAYDAARKAATAVLARQGLRPTSRGGHLVVVDAMRAQFPDVAGLSSLDRLRRRRNEAEYPDPRSYDPVVEPEVDDALLVAAACLASATRLVAAGELGIF
ncbi:MAG: hypothetical protein HY830_27190 [Actinobacteria bacterium]|nr:hypothetical protein [Actinomycetota bacterium]